MIVIICMSGIYMGYRKEKKRKAASREGYGPCSMVGWSREDIVGKNEYLYVMS